jgi:hypothetical protein
MPAEDKSDFVANVDVNFWTATGKFSNKKGGLVLTRTRPPANPSQTIG